MSLVRHEIRELSRLAWPVIATQLGMVIFGLTDVWMIGRLGARELAGVALGDVVIFGTFILGFGLIQGIDPIVSQAHGARDGKLVGSALQRGVVVALLASIPLAVIWLNVDSLLLLFRQSGEMAAIGQTYATPQILSIAPFLLFAVMRQYLLGRGMMLPPLWIVLGANVANVFLNWVLIFGKLGMPAMGVLGAGWATAITRSLMMVGLWVLVFARGLHEGAWIPWSRECLRWGGIRKVLAIGGPLAVQIGLEVWAFQASTIIAGHIGESTTAAHIIVLRLASFSFMVPLGVSIASATRVGNLLGARRKHDAQHAAWVALGMGGAVMCFSALVFVLFPRQLATFFNRDPEVVAIAVGIFPIAAAFQIFDGIQIVGAGVLRGMGTPRPAAMFNFLGFYVLALPVGYLLVKLTDLELRGIWIGLSFGLAVVAAFFVLWIAYRGPARLERLAIDS